jgi:hypothetical protein
MPVWEAPVLEMVYIYKIFHTVKVDLYFLVANCRVIYQTRRVTSLKCHVTQETYELCWSSCNLYAASVLVFHLVRHVLSVAAAQHRYQMIWLLLWLPWNFTLKATWRCRRNRLREEDTLVLWSLSGSYVMTWRKFFVLLLWWTRSVHYI